MIFSVIIYVRCLASELKRKSSNQAAANGVSVCANKLKGTRTWRMFSVHQHQIQEHFTSVSKSRHASKRNISEHKLQGLEIRVVTATIIGNNEKQVFLLEMHSAWKVLIGRGIQGCKTNFSITWDYLPFNCHKQRMSNGTQTSEKQKQTLRLSNATVVKRKYIYRLCIPLVPICSKLQAQGKMFSWQVTFFQQAEK